MSILDLRWRKKKPPPPSPTPPPVVPMPTGPSQPIRVTSEIDGEILNRGYAYWPQSVLEPAGTVLCFAGHADGRPRFFRVDLASGHFQRLGPLLKYQGTGEGMYWTASSEIMLCDGPRLRRVQPLGAADTVVLDVSSTHPGCDVFQAHSSSNGDCHSATVRQIVESGAYPKLGTVVLRQGQQTFYAANGDLDESHIDASGRWLIIEESNGNRVVDLVTGRERWLSDRDGALAHIDCSVDVAVGENDQLQACVEMNLDTLTQRALFATGRMGHVSVRGRRCLHTDDTSLRLIDLDSGAIASLVSHGMVGSGYDFQCHANLDPSGQMAAWVSNAAGRMDLYVMGIA